MVRAFQLWEENERRWNKTLVTRTGALRWGGPDPDEHREAIALLAELGVQLEPLTVPEVERRFPQINFDGVLSAYFEHGAGFVRARESCRAVLEGFLAEGGDYRESAVRPGTITSGAMAGISLADGTRLSAETYVFACGPWLPQLFPDVLGSRITPTRQEVFFFQPPAGDDRFTVGKMPTWVDYSSDRIFYGVPAYPDHGFKVADDTRGPKVDPTTQDRTPTEEWRGRARAFVARRFPALRDAPITSALVCQYEESQDEHFIVDRHPTAANVWLVGGGSGHGFKHGPALGERVALQVLGERPLEPQWSLSRFR
jgi:glycine/D-amino acid oxidase-like deaminating enzyme